MRRESGGRREGSIFWFSFNVLGHFPCFFLFLCECLFRFLQKKKRDDSCTLFKTVVPVFLVVHVCRTVDRVVGHPRPLLSGIGVPWVSLPGPTDVP